jgi:hypothetical protein
MVPLTRRLSSKAAIEAESVLLLKRSEFGEDGTHEFLFALPAIVGQHGGASVYGLPAIPR